MTNGNTGRVDPGETTEMAARRECEEEAGVRIKLKGVVKVEFRAFRFEDKHSRHHPQRDYCRMRIIYYAEPDLGDNEQKDNEEEECLMAKSIPDYESMGACWVTPEEVEKVKVRSYEPRQWVPYVANGGTVYPLGMLECEQRNLRL